MPPSTDRSAVSRTPCASGAQVARTRVSTAPSCIHPLLTRKDPQAGIYLDQAINRQGTRATLAWPMVVVVAAGTILAGLYNTMNERRRGILPHPSVRSFCVG